MNDITEIRIYCIMLRSSRPDQSTLASQYTCKNARMLDLYPEIKRREWYHINNTDLEAHMQIAIIVHAIA